MARAIPVRGAMGTLLFVLMFILSFLVLYFFGDRKSPMFFFLGTFTVFLLIAVVVCFDNLGRYNKLVQKSEEMRNAEFNLTRCPDYWRKRVVRDPVSGAKVHMCSNELVPGQFVSGSLTGGGTNGYLGVTVDSLREKAEYKDADASVNAPAGATPGAGAAGATPGAGAAGATPPAGAAGTERFVAGPKRGVPKRGVREGFAALKVGDAGYAENLHQHTNIDLDVHDDVTPLEGNNYNRRHTHKFRRAITGTHSHTGVIGANPFGDGTDGMDMYDAAYDNFNHWINPMDTEGGGQGMEINLNKLNETENKCDLANVFPWTQAYTKCTV